MTTTTVCSGWEVADLLAEGAELAVLGVPAGT
jgi:hypothetical protein